MIDGCHCTNKDLDLLIKETNKVKASPTIENIDEFLKLVARFDKDIADNMFLRLKHASNKDETIRIIDSNINELKQLVIVDIYEHQ